MGRRSIVIAVFRLSAVKILQLMTVLASFKYALLIPFGSSTSELGTL